MSSVTQYQSGAAFTQTSAIPLTTILTPNADCTAASAYVSTFWAGNQWAYQLDSGIRKPTCYPSDYSAYQYKSKLWYSPGVCPQSYQYVATSTITHDNAPVTTFAVCCPPYEACFIWSSPLVSLLTIVLGASTHRHQRADGPASRSSPQQYRVVSASPTKPRRHRPPRPPSRTQSPWRGKNPIYPYSHPHRLQYSPSRAPECPSQPRLPSPVPLPARPVLLLQRRQVAQEVVALVPAQRRG